MDDYRQPDTPETANEVEMLLDQQAEQAVSNEASKETSADMKAEPVNLEEIVQPKEQLEEVKEQPEELMEEAQEQPEESELTELTKEQSEESEQAELKEKQLDELDDASTEESQEGSMELSMEPSMESSMEVEAKPEDEATREAQSSVFGQAVTLDAIHDSELIKTVNRAKQLLNDLDEAEKDKTRLTGELKQSEKAYSSMEKSVAEGITTALKKKKEEIEVKNNAESLVYNSEKTLNDLGDKISGEEKAKVETEIDNTKKALETNDTEKIKEATEKLTKVFYDMSEQLYKNANPNGAAGVDPNTATSGNGADNGSDANNGGDNGNVYDADYKVEDDK